MGHEVTRAVKADLLEVEADEHHASLGRNWPLDDRACHFEHHGDPRGVVVRARVEHAPAHAQMVEMGCHDHPLVTQLRVRSAQQGTDVPALDGPGLLAGYRLDVSAVKQRSELEPAKLLDQVGNCLLCPCSTPAAEFGRREHFHHVTQASLLGLRRLLRAGAGLTTVADRPKRHASHNAPGASTAYRGGRNWSIRTLPPPLFRKSMRLS